MEPLVVTDGSGGAPGLESRKLSSKTKRDKEKQSCKSCGETFNSITKRKHHCKLCGVVICGKCSEFKAENSRQSRVCRGCFLTEPVAPTIPSTESSTEPKQSMQLSTADLQPSVLCGPLQLSEDGVAWNEVWAAIPTSAPQVLRLQRSSQDGPLLNTIHLPSCTVHVPDPKEAQEAGHTWRLQQDQQTWYLSASSSELQRRWLEALNTAAHRDTAQDSADILQPQGLAGTAAP